MPTLTASAFEMLLVRLDADPAAAVDKYEVLRLKLTKCVCWKGCSESDADALADDVLDRVAVKLAGGEVIENLNAYACEVLRYVYLEHSRKKRDEGVGDDLPEIAVEPDISVLNEPDVRLNCLRKCMNEVVPETDDRMLIVGYYDADAGKKNKDQRKDLAARLGLTMTTLKVKACRIRARIEKCINDCVAAAVTKMRRPDTSI